MTFRRNIALLLSLVLLLTALTSCAKTPEKLVEKADAKLTSTAYVVEVELDFVTADKDVAGIFEQLGAAESTLYYKDGKMMAKTALSINYGEGEAKFTSEYIVADGILYLDNRYTMSGTEQRYKNKAQIDSERAAALGGELSVIGGFSLDDFTDVSVEKTDGESVIVCRSATEDKIIELERALLRQLESSSDIVELKDVEARVEIDGDRYDTITIICYYDVTLQGKVYSVSMTVELDYDYNEKFEINAPADAGEYTYHADVEEII